MHLTKVNFNWFWAEIAIYCGTLQENVDLIVILSRVCEQHSILYFWQKPNPMEGWKKGCTRKPPNVIETNGEWEWHKSQIICLCEYFLTTTPCRHYFRSNGQSPIHLCSEALFDGAKEWLYLRSELNDFCPMKSQKWVKFIGFPHKNIINREQIYEKWEGGVSFWPTVVLFHRVTIHLIIELYIYSLSSYFSLFYLLCEFPTHLANLFSIHCLFLL